jgi:DNA ligase-1
MSTTISGLFIRFAETAEAIGATTKRLEKAATLGKYFQALSDADLVLAARYFGGTIFPQRDQRTANIGGAALFHAVQNVTNTPESTLSERLVAHGDMGDVAFEVFQTSPHALHTPQLTLHTLNTFFETLSATSGSIAKRSLVITQLQTLSPLEAKYFVKLLTGDLRIGLKEGAVEDAIARAAEVKVGQVQWTNMLTGDIGETALLARHNALESAQMRLFHPLKFMLASPTVDMDDIARQMPESFAVEDKYDGIRAQVHIAPHLPGDETLHGTTVGDKRVALFSRTLDEITRSFPDLWKPLSRLLPDGATGLIFDGEIVPVSGEQILPFQELQKRLGRKIVSAEVLSSIPVAFIAYDILFGPQDVLINQPWSERRQILESLCQQEFHARCTPSRMFSDAQELDAEFDAARARGNEGLMVKHPGATYKPGRRGKEWLKVKRALASLDVVVTAVEVGNGRRSKFLSDFTFAVRASKTDPTLLNVGKAYSGLTDKEIEELSIWFREHTLQEFAHGKVRVVEPKVVIEVTFDRVQPSPRHKSGYALRFPRILRIRDDKPVEEIDTLEAVKKLAE